MGSFGEAESAARWAERVARRLLEPMGSRWRHTLGVVDRARVVGAALEGDEAEALLAAAYLHDIGYAPELAETGFHPLDGARFVRGCDHKRLAGLVAYHGGARAEAAERGLLSELLAFEDEHSVVSRALTYCDLTTGPEGQLVDAAARLAEIRQRYGPASPEARGLECAEAALLEDVRVVGLALAEKTSGAIV